ncbi:hypothetical protein [Polyangium sorediatum]|uniref:Lantibiotic biosynthesis protein dehydration domain-containing protein n=1 Tax=Polyangium sorediatum TaxID=889274 RepID=A0ABT6PB02_9BACT|nr:hypothetical protein [Polyangium sorediatum]MDI1437694.1 hypothetical protein [Polyangium sorediatum]
MANARTHLGDAHNFGRRVTRRDGRILKPRTVFWEWLLLAAESPLRRFLTETAEREGLGADLFGYLPDLKFSSPRARDGGEVEAVTLEPLPAPSSAAQKRELARIVGRSVALWSFLGVADLHWENLVLGVDGRGRVVFTPLDVEMILADLSLPTETKLLPDADPEVAAICRHAAGVRRALPYLGKPIDPADLVAMASAYQSTLVFLERHARAIAGVFAGLPELGEMPIRVCLRGTEEYVRARPASLWPPLLDAEKEQLARGDIPYFFQLYGRRGIHWFGNRELTRIDALPLEGDVPQPDPVLQVSRGFRSPTRTKLREDGLFTLLGAFDHGSFAGKHEADGLAVTFKKRALVVNLPDGEELESRRNLSTFVGSVYSPCRCGEVLSVFVPEVTVCEATAR